MAATQSACQLFWLIFEFRHISPPAYLVALEGLCPSGPWIWTHSSWLPCSMCKSVACWTSLIYGFSFVIRLLHSGSGSDYSSSVSLPVQLPVPVHQSTGSYIFIHILELSSSVLSWLYTYRFSCLDMFVHYFVNYFVRLRTNHYRLLTISPILFIFDSAKNLTRNFPYLLFDVSWKYRLSGKNGETRDEKNDWRDGLQNAIYKLIVSLISPTFFHILVNLTISV